MSERTSVPVQYPYRCTLAWIGKKKHTRISLKNTITASTTWKLYPVNAVGTLQKSRCISDR